MAVEPNLKGWELVDRGVNHHLSVPEFQRGFVWKPIQVRDLAESLWLDYPVGSLLIWNSNGRVEERIASEAQRPNLWIVDGQQRTTALCILFVGNRTGGPRRRIGTKPSTGLRRALYNTLHPEHFPIRDARNPASAASRGPNRALLNRI